MVSWTEIVEEVGQRAGHRCEYCRMHQALQGATFHIEHILPSSQGGQTILENLALACPGCNLHKSHRVEIVDPATGQSVPFFHPRTDVWLEHFRWEGYRLEGLTTIGRATIDALQLNSQRRLLIRQAEELFGLFPE